MKTIYEIINQNPVFLNDFDSKDNVIREFAGERWGWDEEKEDYFIETHKNTNILFASYGCANYSGDAWVLFEQNGELYEVNGNHCSCFGLEGQWDSEKVSLKELEHRLLEGTFGEDDWSDNNFKKELCEFLGVEYVENLDKW